MKTNLLASILTGLALLAGSADAQIINLRLSVKIIVHPTSGNMPSGISAQTLTNAINAANEWMASYWRGYRYQLTEVVAIGGPNEGGSSGPSRWFGKTFRGGTEWTTFYNLAQTNGLYRLRTNQVNIWVATPFADPGDSGGAMPIPPGEVSTLGGQIFVDDGAWWVVHELGHFFGLLHTFNGESKDNCTPGDDGLTDTLPDSNCWTSLNQVAQYYFGRNYDALNDHQKIQVGDVYFNVMSYHEATNKNTLENRLTEQQLDRITDHANGDRHAFATGFTRHVSSTGNNGNSGLLRAAPMRTVLNAVNASASGGGDIVLIQPGNYNETMTINRPVTLRATRAGSATLGKP